VLEEGDLAEKEREAKAAFVLIHGSSRVVTAHYGDAVTAAMINIHILHGFLVNADPDGGHRTAQAKCIRTGALIDTAEQRLLYCKVVEGVGYSIFQ